MLNMNKIESEEVFDKPTNYGSTTINESDKCSDIEKETLIYVPSTGNYGSTTINESDKCSDIEKLIYVPSAEKKTLI